MATVSKQTGKTVWSDAGKALGRVDGVLIDPRRARVAAMLVRRAGIVGRKRIVPLAVVGSWGAHGPKLARKKLPSAREAETALAAVIERLTDPLGLPVKTSDARDLGKVRDLKFAGVDGSIESIEVSRGVLSDLASGSVVVKADRITKIAGSVLVEAEPPTGEPAAGRFASAMGRRAGRAFAKAKRAATSALAKLENADE